MSSARGPAAGGSAVKDVAVGAGQSHSTVTVMAVPSIVVIAMLAMVAMITMMP